MLRNARIHHDRPGKAMRRIGAQVAAHEHLPAAAQMGRRLEIPAIDHCPGGNMLAIIERDAVCCQCDHTGPGPDRFLRQLAPQRSVEVPAGERAIGRAQRPAVGGEGDGVAARPFGLAKGCEQIGAGVIQIAGKPAPAVISAENLPRFEQGKAQLRMCPVDCQRGKPACKPTSDDCDIEHALSHRQEA